MPAHIDDVLAAKLKPIAILHFTGEPTKIYKKYENAAAFDEAWRVSDKTKSPEEIAGKKVPKQFGFVEKAAKSFAGMATGVIGMVVGGAAGGGINAATGGVNYGSYAVKHQGGIAWDSAPRLHRGLAADEFPAILQQGETVTPKSGVQATVNIINQSSQPVTGHVQKTAFDGKSYVTSVVLEDFASNGRIAQALGR